MLRLGRIPHRPLPCAEVVAVLPADLVLDELHQGGGDRRIADQAHDLEHHRQVRRLPGRLDQIHGVDDVAFLPGDEGEERPGDGAFRDLGPWGRGSGEQEQAESDGEETGGEHERLRRVRCRVKTITHDESLAARAFDEPGPPTVRKVARSRLRHRSHLFPGPHGRGTTARPAPDSPSRTSSG